MDNRPRIYVAAPLFNELERGFNFGLAMKLALHVNVFLPQRDGELLVELIELGLPVDIAERRVFQNDQRAMRVADLLVAVLDGSHIDEGVAFEIGFSNGIGIPCIGLQTDIRRALPSGNNPMIAQSLTHVFASVNELVDWVQAWSTEQAVTCKERAA